MIVTDVFENLSFIHSTSSTVGNLLSVHISKFGPNEIEAAIYTT